MVKSLRGLFVIVGMFLWVIKVRLLFEWMF